MKQDSIRKHLAPRGIYSIAQKRSTTINHAFASAIAPIDRYDEASISEAVIALGQDPDAELKCVYCDGPAQGWDHLHPLVKEKQLSGYGHLIRNLVPSCRDCNSDKGGKDWQAWLLGKGGLAVQERISRIRDYAAPLEGRKGTLEAMQRIAPDLMQKYAALRSEIIRLMGEADQVAAELRERTATYEA